MGVRTSIPLPAPARAPGARAGAGSHLLSPPEGETPKAERALLRRAGGGSSREACKLASAETIRHVQPAR